MAAQNAAGGGNSACAHFCAAVFGADTPAAGQCTSDGAHGKGLCATGACATKGAPDATKVCCVKQNGVCPTYATATCCAGKDTCGVGNPGTPGVCGCTKTTCAAQGKNCVSIGDGCGGTLQCGTCPSPQVCPFAPANVCSCPANTCGGSCTCPSNAVCQSGQCVFPHPIRCTCNDNTVLPIICRVVDCSTTDPLFMCGDVCGASRGGAFKSECFLFDVCTP